MLINSKITSKRILYGVGKKKQLPKIYLPKCELKSKLHSNFTLNRKIGLIDLDLSLVGPNRSIYSEIILFLRIYLLGQAYSLLFQPKKLAHPFPTLPNT